MSNFKLKKGEEYYLKYSEKKPTKFNQSGSPIQYKEYEYHGYFKYMGKNGFKHHFYHAGYRLNIYITMQHFFRINKP